MPDAVPRPNIAALRARIAHLEGEEIHARKVLPFGVDALDRRLPQGGLEMGCLHEVASGGRGALDGAAAACFAAGIAARQPGPVLWCVTQADLFAAGLEQVGLFPDRVIYVEAGDENAVLASMEEGLRHGGLGAVVADVASLSMTASRRLHLAAKASGTIGIALRRWRREADASDFGQPTAAMTRWRVSVLPSAPLGGNTPLGYEVRDRKLVVRKEDAAHVRWIFTRFIELGSATELARDVDSRNIRTSRGNRIDKKAIYRILNNRVYIGDAVHKGESYPGEHVAIIDQSLWDKVHTILTESPRIRAARTA